MFPPLPGAGHARVSYRPHLDLLEDRYCPTDLAPFLSMTAITTGANEVRIAGQVMDESPAGLEVNFSGVYEGTTTTDANGYFEITATPTALGTITGTVIDAGGQSGSMDLVVSSMAPSLFFSGVVESGTTWRFSGFVMDEWAAGLTVQFGGILGGRSTTVQADGSFTLVVDLQGQTGQATATVTDGWGLQAPLATYEVGLPPPPPNMAPMVSLAWSPVSQTQIRLTGSVLDEAPGGLTVTFGGIYQGSTVTDAQGFFDITVTATALGTLSAQVVDAGGLEGFNSVIVSSMNPMLMNFTAILESGTLWRFTGSVLDECATGLLIQFGGVLGTRTTTVQADGTFCLVVDLQGQEGWATALTSDWWGLASNLAETYVSSPS